MSFPQSESSGFAKMGLRASPKGDRVGERLAGLAKLELFLQLDLLTLVFLIDFVAF